MANPVYALLSPVVLPIFEKKVISVSGVEHLPKSGGYIIAANHVDWLDGFYIVAITKKYRNVPTFFLSKSRNYWWTGIAAQIPADRSKIIDAAVAQLQNGRVICNFPEGERNDTPILRPGKTGTVRMAAEAGVPVIPLGITCSSGQTMRQSFQNLFSQQHPVSFVFGAPLEFTTPKHDISSEWLTEQTAKLMSAIAVLAHKSV